MFTKIDQAEAAKITKDVEALLQKYAEENGLVYSREGRGMLGAQLTDFTFKVNFKIEGKKSHNEAQAESQFKLAIMSLNLTEEVRTTQGMEIQLVGYNSRKWKRPFIAKNIRNNKEYVLSEDQATNIFKKVA